MKLGTLADLAKLDGMPSQPSLARLITAREDFPVLQHGRYGKPFIFDLEAAAAFVREHWRDGRIERRRRRLAEAERVPALQLSFPLEHEQ